MRRTFFILIGMLIISFAFLSKGGTTFAIEGSQTGNVNETSSYFFIYYNDGERVKALNENVTLTLTGWTNEAKTSANGKIEINSDTSSQIKDIIINVTDELNEVKVSENESIYFKLADSESFDVKEITPLQLIDQIKVVTENENGTSIKEVKIIDEYGTVIQKDFKYYIVDESNQEVEILKEQYDSLNSTVDTSIEIETIEDPSVYSKITTNEINHIEDTSTYNTKIAVPEPSVKYASYVQNIGWQSEVSDGKISGTEGKALRLEAIKIFLENVPETWGISYKTHIQYDGWHNSVSNGAISGTSGESKRLEAIQINLNDEMAEHYDVYYRVHAESYGWLDWAKNGESAGTQGLSKRLEAIEIKLVEKGGVAPGPTYKPFIVDPSIVYSTHVQNYGWMDYVEDGVVSGTEGQSLRIEAINIDLKNAPYSGGLIYSTHIQDYGWYNNVTSGEVSGSTGKGKQVEAIKVNLTGEMAEHYDVYYRVHAEYFGWLDWAKNGNSAGTEGLSKRLEAVQIVLVEKGEAAPGATDKPFLTAPSIIYSTHVQENGWMDFVKDGQMSGTQGQAKRLEAIKIGLQNSPYSGDIIYSTHVQDYGWLNNVSNGAVSGRTGESKRLEAIKINLTGDVASFYDVYYRVHIESYGWLGWAKNGMKAGSEGLSKRLEAIEIKLVPKDKGEAVSEKEAYKQPLKTVFLDPGHGGTDPGATAGGYQEADLNLAVAKKVQSLLLERGFVVYMSRSNDTSISLIDRAKMANNLDTDIFISFHHNAGGAQGIESYYYRYKEQYPSKINSEMHNDPERVSKSITLTRLIQENMVNYTGAVNRGTDGASFQVIRESAMPATLLELGFIDNTSERQKLVTDSYQNKLARAIADGIDEYFNMYY